MSARPRPPAAPEPSFDDAFWTVKDLARVLKISVSWVYKAVAQARLPCFHVGAMVRFEPSAIRAWLEAKKKAGASLTVTGNESVTSKSAPSNHSEG